MEHAVKTFSCRRTKFLGENRSQIPIGPQMFAKITFLAPPHAKQTKSLTKSSFAGRFERENHFWFFLSVVVVDLLGVTATGESIYDRQVYCAIKSLLLVIEDVQELFGFNFLQFEKILHTGSVLIGLKS
jgi:hypothetical protein